MDNIKVKVRLLVLSLFLGKHKNACVKVGSLAALDLAARALVDLGHVDLCLGAFSPGALHLAALDPAELDLLKNGIQVVNVMYPRILKYARF